MPEGSTRQSSPRSVQTLLGKYMHLPQLSKNIAQSLPRQLLVDESVYAPLPDQTTYHNSLAS
eukprot:14888333-Heterocapsa_arctica.AAC.2